MRRAGRATRTMERQEMIDPRLTYTELLAHAHNATRRARLARAEARHDEARRLTAEARRYRERAAEKLTEDARTIKPRRSYEELFPE